MASGSVASFGALVCFLLAVLAYARRWPAGVWLGAAGVAILGGALVARGLRAGRWPLISEHEFALAYAFGVGLAALLVPSRRRPMEPGPRLMGHLSRRSEAVRATATLMAAALVVYARLGLPAFKRSIQPLPPALDSVWLPLHAGVAALAYGALTLAGAAGLVWLARETQRTSARQALDRGIAAGYPLLTLSMLLGTVWAQVAWGRYWGWDLKEVWTLVIWLVCTLYYHVRRRPSWQGRRLAWLALAGLGAVMFTFLGVDWLARVVGLESLHLF